MYTIISYRANGQVFRGGYCEGRTDSDLRLGTVAGRDEAKRVANKLSEEFVGPKHEVTDLDLDGYPVYKYHGG